MRCYFAYGSNMDVRQMGQRCPGATLLWTATLGGYRFIINRRGVATVIVAAQRLRTRIETPFRDDDNYRQKILDYFRVNGPTVAQTLQAHNDQMVRLSQRRGTYYGNLIESQRFRTG